MATRMTRSLFTVCLLVLMVALPYSSSLAKKEVGNLTGVLKPYVPKPTKVKPQVEPKVASGEGETTSKNTNETPGVGKEGAKTKEGCGKNKEKASPISITALRMEADNKAGWVLFVGKVKAIQKEMVLTSDRLKVFLDQKGKVKRVVATGNVRVEQGGRVITSSKAEYNPTKETVVFTGSPKAWQGKNVVMGKRILYFVKENRSVVEGGNGKVSAVLFPKKNKKGGK